MNKRITLLVIILFGIFLRFYQLGLNPSILNRDEAALAYNAYLLKETNTDEWGRLWPLALESFGDYKLIGYPLLIRIFFQILPISDLTVRLPSALAGAGILILSYYIAKRIFKKSELHLLTLLTIATTPVFIFYSKFAYEAHLALFFVIFSLFLYFFYKANFWTDTIALISMLYACITYNTPLLLLPFIVVALILSRSPKIYKQWLYPVVSLTVIFVIIFSQLSSLTTQKSGITIFKDENLILRSAEYYQSFTPILRPVLGNNYIFFAGEMSKRFFSSFSYTFLVTTGGNHPWHTLPGWGNILLPVYLFGLTGIVYTCYQIVSKTIIFLMTRNVSRFLEYIHQEKDKILLLYFLFVTLTPSVITIDSPHTTRSLLFLFIFCLFSVYGIIVISSILKKYFTHSHLKNYFLAIVSISYIILIIVYLQDYSQKYPTIHPKLYSSKYPSIIAAAQAKYPNEKIAIVDESGYLYITTAWYLKMQPELFYATIKKQLPNSIGLRYGEQLGNYHFIADKKDIINMGENVLVYMNTDTGVWELQKL